MLDVIRRFGGNLLEVSQDSILSLFTSEVAIIIYVFVILAIIAVLVVAVIFTQRKDKTQSDDEALGEAHLCVDVYDYRAGYPVEKRARLNRDTLNALFSLNIMSFPDEIPFESKEKILDGTFLTFFVTDQNGNVLKKRLSYENEQKILGLILPYVKKLKGKSI